MAATGSDAKRRKFTDEEESPPLFKSSIGFLWNSLYKVVKLTEPFPKSQTEVAFKLQNAVVNTINEVIKAKIDKYRAWKKLCAGAYGPEEKQDFATNCIKCVEDFADMVQDVHKMSPLLAKKHEELLMNTLNSFDKDE